MFRFGILFILKYWLWRTYDMQRVGLGLWGRCVWYVEHWVSYARQQILYHMHTKTAYYIHAKHMRIICTDCTPKSIFAYQYHDFLFLFGVLFIRIFMRPVSFRPCHDWCSLMAEVSFTRIMHCKNCSEKLWGTWQRVQGVALASKSPYIKITFKNHLIKE